MTNAKKDAKLPRDVAAARLAIDAMGGTTQCAKTLGLPKSTVSSWRGLGVSPKHLARMSAFSGIPMAKIRPGIFSPA